MQIFKDLFFRSFFQCLDNDNYNFFNGSIVIISLKQLYIQKQDKEYKFTSHSRNFHEYQL